VRFYVYIVYPSVSRLISEHRQCNQLIPRVSINQLLNGASLIVMMTIRD